MINKHKIITMTQLALYDRHEGEADRMANEYFRHDYIYRKNMWTRLFVGLGTLMLLAVYWLRLIFVDGADIFAMDLQLRITDSVLFMLAVLAVYSLIGTIQATRQYYLIQKRLERYLALMLQLERINERVRRQAETEEDSERRYGTDPNRKRNRR